ncbi:MAG: hypothetical protein LC781_14735 [Actinobacteria bacterium]|nr:hypothetical protein [Actinomycetota bacterium]
MIDSGTNTVVGRMIEATWASYRPLLAGLAAVQEQNMKLARYSTGMFLREAERQREAMQAMIEGSFRAYTSLLHTPVSSPSNDGAGAEDGDPDLPIEDYERLSEGEISGELGELSADEVEELREYETKNQNRHAVVERFDRSLV